jgi:hypothetical protein
MVSNHLKPFFGGIGAIESLLKSLPDKGFMISKFFLYRQIYRQKGFHTLALSDSCHATTSDCLQRTEPVPIDNGRGNLPALIKR